MSHTAPSVVMPQFDVPRAFVPSAAAIVAWLKCDPAFRGTCRSNEGHTYSGLDLAFAHGQSTIPHLPMFRAHDSGPRLPDKLCTEPVPCNDSYRCRLRNAPCKKLTDEIDANDYMRISEERY